MPVVVTFFFFLSKLIWSRALILYVLVLLKKQDERTEKKLKAILPCVISSLEEDKLCVGVAEKFFHRQ